MSFFSGIISVANYLNPFAPVASLQGDKKEESKETAVAQAILSGSTPIVPPAPHNTPKTPETVPQSDGGDDGEWEMLPGSTQSQASKPTSERTIEITPKQPEAVITSKQKEAQKRAARKAKALVKRQQTTNPNASTPTPERTIEVIPKQTEGLNRADRKLKALAKRQQAIAKNRKKARFHATELGDSTKLNASKLTRESSIAEARSKTRVYTSMLSGPAKIRKSIAAPLKAMEVDQKIYGHSKHKHDGMFGRSRQ